MTKQIFTLSHERVLDGIHDNQVVAVLDMSYDDAVAHTKAYWDKHVVDLLVEEAIEDNDNSGSLEVSDQAYVPDVDVEYVAIPGADESLTLTNEDDHGNGEFLYLNKVEFITK